MHNNERNFKCEKCDKAYHTPDALEAHMNSYIHKPDDVLNRDEDDD